MKAITEVIQITYDEVKKLELISIPIHIENIYEPLGKLSDCTMFQNDVETLTSDHIKVSYKLFI